MTDPPSPLTATHSSAQSSAQPSAQKMRIQCSLCSFETSNPEYITKHMMIHKPGRVIKYKFKYNCDMCGEKFRRKDFYTKHKTKECVMRPVVVPIIKPVTSVREHLKDRIRLKTIVPRVEEPLFPRQSFLVSPKRPPIIDDLEAIIFPSKRDELAEKNEQNWVEDHFQEYMEKILEPVELFEEYADNLFNIPV